MVIGQTNRFWFPRPHHQIVEHFGRLQIHDSRRSSFRLGFLRPLLSHEPESHHRLCRMGQTSEGKDFEYEKGMMKNLVMIDG